MKPYYLVLSVLGLVTAWWGMSAAHRLRPPMDIVAALAFVAGVCAFLAGTLLAVLPRFFVT